MGSNELGVNPPDEVIDAEIVDETEEVRPMPPPPNFAPPFSPTTSPTSFVQAEEWLFQMRGYLADANFMITEMMGYIPQHKVSEYQQRQLHFHAALGAFDAQWSK